MVAPIALLPPLHRGDLSEPPIKLRRHVGAALNGWQVSVDGMSQLQASAFISDRYR
jgi:hypothetical protein